MGMRRVLLFNLSAVLQLDALGPLPATMMLTPKCICLGAPFEQNITCSCFALVAIGVGACFWELLEFQGTATT
jgi:hypothetical protein